MRISDWSSDVCSSDLGAARAPTAPASCPSPPTRRARHGRGAAPPRAARYRAFSEACRDRSCRVPRAHGIIGIAAPQPFVAAHQLVEIGVALCAVPGWLKPVTSQIRGGSFGGGGLGEGERTRGGFVLR